MPYRRGASRPGDPPNSHVGTLRNSIEFLVRERAVYIGPDRQTAVTDALEFGGMSRVGDRLAAIAKRPYMRPALARSRPHLARMWSSSR